MVSSILTSNLYYQAFLSDVDRNGALSKEEFKSFIKEWLSDKLKTELNDSDMEYILSKLNFNDDNEVSPEEVKKFLKLLSGNDGTVGSRDIDALKNQTLEELDNPFNSKQNVVPYNNPKDKFCGTGTGYPHKSGNKRGGCGGGGSSSGSGNCNSSNSNNIFDSLLNRLNNPFSGFGNPFSSLYDYMFPNLEEQWMNDWNNNCGHTNSWFGNMFGGHFGLNPYFSKLSSLFGQISDVFSEMASFRPKHDPSINDLRLGFGSRIGSGDRSSARSFF